MITLTREERETHIWASESDQAWEIETSSPHVWARLDKIFKAAEVKRDNGRIYAKCYEVPLNAVTIHKPRKVSEAQKERLKAMGFKTAVREKAVSIDSTGTRQRPNRRVSANATPNPSCVQGVPKSTVTEGGKPCTR